MSAVAQAAHYCGHSVSGSDRYYDRGGGSGVLNKLEKMGIILYAQDGSGVNTEIDALVVSTAIEEDNPDLMMARALNLRVLHRSEALAELLGSKDCLAVAGTSGKSTVTAMAGWILEQTGQDPFVVNGAPLNNWRTTENIGNVRHGAGVWVIEADESDRSLLNYRPRHAVITNMSADHFGVDETVALFRAFAAKVRGNVIGALDGNAYLDGIKPHLSAAGSRFSFQNVDFELRVPGHHNVEDALHATMLCGLQGVSVEECAGALRSFRGVHRRLEVVGKSNRITVIDDYGHNPAKIRAAWNVVEPFSRRGVVVWRPHGYGPLRSMLPELTDVFLDICRSGGLVVFLPVYDAGGTADRSISVDALAKSLADAGYQARLAEDYDGVLEIIRQEVCSGDTVVVMGARDPLLPELALSIADQFAQ